ncbi:hypothetical protein RO3G_11696 [Rhizopus delemar RA 99-880]|uniref:Uncharacterized protein n=1 Tax=Rhizopus delemar (strain RA 99-880 / ATCC MYA-4621 / FGSC 9543 / NRRL 43880) TaxID=246409 RepID=I1CEV5_RHIO9|nr:hypothetical protein RO3G_11696 [Rhizopus delemar RA 99-880]|eukprot:EIE86985.1 hypothetical protein RO3G_11696 [Rhizopus delemar RA 99-880]
MHNTAQLKSPIYRHKAKHHLEEQRYLAYLPHSGLSNQRIELANALLLAHMLNRTLIIPPAFLGNVFGWMPGEQLMDHISWLTTPKPFTKLCQKPTPSKLMTYIRQSRCDEYRHLGIMPWSELHDLSPLMPDIKYKFQDIMSINTIQEDLGLSDQDIYIYNDTQLYDWRLYENTPLGITVQSIVEYLGGKGSFMSIHFRTADWPFKKEMPVNLQKFIKDMTDMVGPYKSKECMQVSPEKDSGVTVGKMVNVYIATDHKNPKGEYSAILPWFHEFPCTTTLNDIPAHLFAPLDDLRDMASPSKSLKSFLIPLIDAMVAAHAKRVLTTPRSTFSKYIEQLHRAWSP